jgi:hypothetical protein
MTEFGASLVVAALLSAVHLLAPEIRPAGRLSGRKWLSFAGGVSAGYVFLHILPDLAQRQATHPGFGFELLAGREVFLIALCGLVGFYSLETVARRSAPDEARPSTGRTVHAGLWIHAIVFALYSAVVGYLLTQTMNRDVLPMLAFAIAFGLHFFVNDQSLRRHHGDFHDSKIRWLLAGAVPLGWSAGMLLPVSDNLVTVVYAVLAGGMMLNILKEELPEERQGDVIAFVSGAAFSATVGLVMEIES